MHLDAGSLCFFFRQGVDGADRGKVGPCCFVDTVKSSLATVASEKPAEVTYTTRHGTTAIMNTANIGKAKSVAPPKPETPAPHEPVAPSRIADSADIPPSAFCQNNHLPAYNPHNHRPMWWFSPTVVIRH